MRRRRQHGQGADFLPVSEVPPAEELHYEQPRAVDPDPPERHQLPDLPQGGVVRLPEEPPTLALQLVDLLRQKLPAPPFALEPPAQARRRGLTIPHPSLLQPDGKLSAQLQVKPLGSQQTLDPVRPPDPAGTAG